MTYYFISFDQSKFRDFTERFAVLSDGSWVQSESDLRIVLDSADESTCFFIDFPKVSADFDKWISVIRDQAPTSRIILVTGDQKIPELKSHQMSSFGGDAYISKNVTSETLQQILSGFNVEIQNIEGNKLENTGARQFAEKFELDSLLQLKNDKLSTELDEVFNQIAPSSDNKLKLQSISNFSSNEGEESGARMSNNDQELSLDDLGELEISETPDLPPDTTSSNLGGLDLEMDEGLDLQLGDDLQESKVEDKIDNLPDLNQGIELELTTAEEDEKTGISLDGTGVNALDFGPLDGDLSSDAKEKLAEIDAIMDEDSKINLGIPSELSLASDDGLDESYSTGSSNPSNDEEAMVDNDALDLAGFDDSLTDQNDEKEESIDLAAESFEINDIAPASSDNHIDSDLDQPLVSEDIDLANLDFGMESNVEESTPIAAAPVREDKTSTKIKKPKKEPKEEKEESKVALVERPMGQELREISGAYSAELERMQATMSNLRSDREELLRKIQTMEEEKLLHNRQTLSMRAELDEKKIELSIVRKKLNEDISDLKDRLRLEEERRLILEEKNRILREEVDKASQKNRIDVRKVQMHERELEQRLELLKADAETQIRNRDLKILELKRKIDGMEFDMESIQTQEKRTVESRFELEDKLEKAIKTLRGAISVLEDDTDKGAVLDALKKNIDM